MANNGSGGNDYGEDEESLSIVDELLASCGYDARTLESAMEVERAVMGSVSTSTLTESTATMTAAPSDVADSNLKDSIRVQFQRSDNDNSMLMKAEKELRDAINMLSPQRQEAYQGALTQSPKVVEQESPLRRFLWVCKFNYWRAAEQVCDYWMKRRDVFGETSYANPLRLRATASNQEGTETCEELTALCHDALKVLEGGGYMIAEEVDAYHRPVIIIDRKKIQKIQEMHPQLQLTSNTKAQVWFYVLQVLSESVESKDQANVKVVTILALSNTETLNRHEEKKEKDEPAKEENLKAKEEVRAAGCKSSSRQNRLSFKFDGSVRDLICSGVIPIPPPAAVHVLSQSTRHPYPALFQQWIRTFMTFVQPWLKLRVRVHCYQETACSATNCSSAGADKPDNTCTHYQANQATYDLIHYGLSKHHLPPSYGGTADFRAWYQQRLRLERQRYDINSPSKSIIFNDTSQRPSDQEKSNDEQNQPTSLKRKMRDFQEWAQDHLQQQKVAKLQDQVEALRVQQESFHRRNEFFEAQLTLGNALAQQYEKEMQGLTAMLRHMPRQGRELTLQVFGRMMTTKRSPEDEAEDSESTTTESNEITELWLSDGEAFAQAVVTRYQTFLGLGDQAQQLTSHQVGFLHGLLTCLTATTLAQQQQQQQHNDADVPSSSTPLSAPAESTHDPSDNQDDIEQLRLQSQIKLLQEQQSLLHDQNSFLEASKVSANYLAQTFEEFLQKHLPALVNLCSLFCHDSVQVSEYQSAEDPFYPPTLARWILNNCTCFDGQGFLNPVVTSLQFHSVHSRSRSTPAGDGGGIQNKNQFLLSTPDQARLFMVENPAALRLLLCAVSGRPLTLTQLQDIYQMNAGATAAAEAAFSASPLSTTSSATTAVDPRQSAAFGAGSGIATTMTAEEAQQRYRRFEQERKKQLQVRLRRKKLLKRL